MSDVTPGTAERATHWDDAYANRGAEGVSWFQHEPRVSLELIEEIGISSDTRTVDVGGGASLLVDRLIERDWRAVTVLDVSSAALEMARQRLPGEDRTTWLHEDVLAWRPTERYGLWHDRAVFHFLVGPEERAAYLHVMRESITPDASVIIATFAPDGPEYC